MNPEATVFVVDDDDAMRESLRRLMESVGLAVETFADAQAFLGAYDPPRRARPRRRAFAASCRTAGYDR